MTVIERPDTGDTPAPTPPVPAPAGHGWLDTVTAWWGGHGYWVIAAGLAAVVVFLAVSLIIAKVKHRTDRWISALAWCAGFGFSAEGMWIVATQMAHITPVVAVAVFFVGEAFMLNSMTHARAAYHRTTERNSGGKVTKAGDPGKHGRAVWIIATAMAVVVAFASTNPAEVVLRASIPLGVALLWWNTLTAEGTERAKSRFAWTPTRLLEQVGALVPDENPDLKAMARERRINAMVIAADRAHLGSDRAKRRLRRLARTADARMVAEVAERVRRAVDAETLMVPGKTGGIDAEARALCDMTLQQAAAVRSRLTGARPLALVSSAPARAQLPARPSARIAAGTSGDVAGGTSGGGKTGTSRPPRTGTSGRKVTRKKPARRPAEETRKLAAEIKAAEPGITQKEVAARLGISDRQLREVLNGRAS